MTSYNEEQALARIDQLESLNETQAKSIKGLWVEMARIKKRDDHAQAYIPKLQERISKLEYEASAHGQAEKVFK